VISFFQTKGALRAFSDLLGGAFYTTATGTGHLPTSGMNFTDAQVNFDASRTSSVYTNSGKVYPLSLTLNYIIKA